MSTWQEDFKFAIKTKDELELFLDQKIDDCQFELFIPRPFLKKIKDAGINSPLYKQFIPSEKENQSIGLLDPIGDQNFLVTKNLIHRYHNRALFLPTTNCPVTCRYCFRKNELGSHEIFKNDISETVAYLKKHPEINEIIFTGGDPFILSNEKIFSYAKIFSEIESIKFLRFHTRTPIIMPNRIDDGLVETLLKIKNLFKQVIIMIHTNHSLEIDNEVSEALLKLKKSEVILFSQSVLLKDVNDNEKDLSDLFFKLGTLGIIPYYLHHPDQAFGTDHFQLSIKAGRMIYSKLRKNLSGWLIPQYIIDIPHGKGKVSAFNPESFNFNGELLDINGEFIKI